MIIYYLLFNTFVVILSKRDFGKCLPFSMISSVFAIYFSQMIFGSFNPGIIAVGVMGLSSLLLYAFSGNKKEIRSHIFTMGLIAYLVICVIYLVVDFRRRFSAYDEWYHWGMMVKEAFRLDKFYSVSESHLLAHKDYPPFLCIVELIECKLIGRYSEGAISRALHIFTMSMILPFMVEGLYGIWNKSVDGSRVGAGTQSGGKRLNVRSKTVICISFFYLILGLILINDPYWGRICTTILADVVISVVFAYSFLNVWNASSGNGLQIFDVLCLILSNAAMLMIKQVGVGLLVVTAFMFLLRILICRETPYSNSRINSFIIWIISIAVPLGIYGSWGLYIKKYNIINQFNLANIKPEIYIDALLGRGDELNSSTLYSFFRALFERNISTVKLLPFTYVSGLLIVYLIIIILHFVFREEFSQRKALVMGLSFTAGTGGYAFMMSILYIFCFNPVEMAQLASYERYMASYVLGEMLILFVVGIYLVVKKFSFVFRPTYIFIAALLMIIINSESMSAMEPQLIKENRAVMYEESAYRLRSVAGPESKVMIIYDKNITGSWNWYGVMQVFVNYYANDLKMDYDCSNAFEYMPGEEEFALSIVANVKRNDYLYVINTNDNISSLLGEYTEEGKLEASTIYSVEDKDGELFLKIERQD